MVALLLVAKPLIAFNMYKRVLNAKDQSSHFLLLRLIKKRKEGDYAEDMIAEVCSVQQNISAPVFKSLLRYASFIALFFVSNFRLPIRNIQFYLRNTLFKIVPATQYSLLVGKLSI